MRDRSEIPAGLKVAGIVVGGLLALSAFHSLGEWLVFDVFRRHTTAVKVVGAALMGLCGLALWGRQAYDRPSWMTRPFLAWVAAISGFLAALLLFPFDRGSFE